MDILSRIVIMLARLLLGMDNIQLLLLKLVGELDANAIETSPKNIERIVTNTQLAVQNPTFGLSALHDDIANIAPPAGPTNQDVLDAIAALPAGSDLVIPPAGPSSSEIWDYQLYPSGLTTGQHLKESRALAYNLANIIGLPYYKNPNFLIAAHWADADPAVILSDYPRPDFDDIRADDTRLTWLQRGAGGLVWTADYYTGEPVGEPHDEPLGAFYTFYCGFTEAAFQAWKGRGVVGGAPIWPGDEGVTKGEAVALTDALVLAGPLHGILLDLTVLPSGGTAWQVGATKVPYNWGQVGFMSDNGQMEQFQWLSAEHSVYLPKQMVVAESASFRVTRPCTATVRPFTIP